jgi:hypothetical protein
MSGQFSAGSFAGIALASLPMLRWRPCKHCAIIVAGVPPVSLPTSCWPLCPCGAGIAAFVAPALQPALQTGILPTTKQLQHVHVCGVVVVVIFLTCGYYYS